MTTETCATEDLPLDYCRRMRNWARSSAEIGLTTISSIYNGEFSGRGETRMPLLMGEATDTHAALYAIPAEEQHAVGIFWQNEGRGMRWLGRMLGCSDKTAKNRFLRGSALHQIELARRADVAARVREENELTMRRSTADHSRTGSVSVVIRL